MKTDPDDEFVDVFTTSFYRDTAKKMTPGRVMRLCRGLSRMTREQLGRKLGRFTRQQISDLERGERPISKKVAERLAAVFDVPVQRFVEGGLLARYRPPRP